MRKRFGGTLILFCLLAGQALAAAPRPAPQQATSAGITVTGITGHAVVLSPEALATLATVQLTVSFQTEHGPRHGTFAGPPLWTVLDHLGAIGVNNPRSLAHEVVLVTGSDGYAAALALGEIAPVFEGKQVILAEQEDGHPLGAGHLRIVVPGDRFGGRYVRDVVRITVTAPPGR